MSDAGHQQLPDKPGDGLGGEQGSGPGIMSCEAANFVPYTPKHKSPIKTNNAGDYLYSPGFPQVECTAVGTEIVCDPGKKHR